MNDSSSTHCPSCGAALAAGATGACPRCLMLAAMEPTAHSGGSTRQSPPLLETVQAAFPQLEILELIGRGGMGVVYRARQKSLDRMVALKLLAPERVDDPAFAERFVREAQALAKLNHPHIVTIHDFGEAGGFFYLLMEFVDGVNLRQAMKAGHFTPEQALAIVPPVCEALQYAHEHGIVHRDIKPENLLLDKDGRVKIADFGIAKMLGSDADTAARDEGPQAGTLASVAGTPQYMAPEQKAHRATDHRADIYSLGVVLYELLTGELPADKLQPPSRKVQIDVRLDEIVLRALEKTPELRYQTAADFRTQVETMVETPGGDRGKFAAAGSGTPANGTSSRGPLRLAMVEKSGEQRVIVWPNVVGAFLVDFGYTVLAIMLFSLFAPMSIGEMATLSIFTATVLTGAGIIAGLKTPLAALTPLGQGMSAPPASPAAGVGQLQTPSDGWQAPPTGWGHLVGIFFGITFTSPLAFQLANISALGFLGFLGFVGLSEIDGLRWCLGFFGFSGFFGLIGVASIVERAHRRKTNAATPTGTSHKNRVSDGMNQEFSLKVIGAVILVLAGFAIFGPRDWRGNAIGTICCLAVIAFFQFLAWTAKQKSDAAPIPALPPQSQPRWQGWDVWVVGLCLTIFGALWLLRLSEGRLLNRSLFAGAGVGSNVVLPVALATTILLAGAAFLYMLARNIKTAAPTRAESCKRQIGRSVVPAVAVILLLRTFVIHAFVVPNNSMSPEITKGSRILVWKLTSTYVPGDIVAYRHEDKVWVARVTQVGPTMLTLQKNSKPSSEVQREAVVGKVISVFWRPSPGVNSGVMQPPPQRAENAGPAAANAEPWSPSPVPISTEDVRKISTDAKALQELGRYEEALQRHLWLHHHALEIVPSLFGLRMSFWLSDWAELAHRFPKAKQALIEIRDQKSHELAAGRGDLGLFIDVDRINSDLRDDGATLALSKQIEGSNPELAKQCASLVEEAAVRLFEQRERVITPSRWPLEKALADLQAAKAERDLLPSKSFPSEAHKENETLRIERKVELFEELAARRRAQLEQSLPKP